MKKQVIVIRKDLNMRKGKMVAQGSHAAMAFLTNAIRTAPRVEKSPGIHEVTITLSASELEWSDGIFTKICVSVNSEEELKAIIATAREAGLPASEIVDCGLTEFHGVPTLTAAAVGPAEASEIDLVTGHLPLL